MIKSPIDGSEMSYFPRNEFLFRIFISTNIISVLIVVVLAVVAGIFLLRIILSSTSALTVGGVQLGGIITALINAVQIQVLNAIYNTVAIRLTEYENHRTNTAYEDALIGKTFIFQFVNSFSSLFYIAFVKPYIQYLDPCIGNDILFGLLWTFFIFFVARLFCSVPFRFVSFCRKLLSRTSSITWYNFLNSFSNGFYLKVSNTIFYTKNETTE
jgi:hypothetical protein